MCLKPCRAQPRTAAPPPESSLLCTSTLWCKPSAVLLPRPRLSRGAQLKNAGPGRGLRQGNQGLDLELKICVVVSNWVLAAMPIPKPGYRSKTHRLPVGSSSLEPVGSIRLQGLLRSTDSGCHLLCRGRDSSGPAINEKLCQVHCLFQRHCLFPERPPTPGWKGDTPQKDADKLKAPGNQSCRNYLGPRRSLQEIGNSPFNLTKEVLERFGL